MKNAIVIFSTLFTSYVMHAQIDSTYIKRLNKKYSVEFYTSYKMLSVEHTVNKTERVAFEPNSLGGLGVGFSWKNSSISYVFQIPAFSNDNKGKSTASDFQYHHYADSFLVDFYYQNYKGFTYGIDNKFEAKNYLKDMKINLYGGIVQFVHNHKQFSIAAAHKQNRKQLKSAGSLLYGFEFFLVKMNNMPEFEDYTKTYDRRTYNLGPNIGYGQNWIFYKDYFVAGSFTIGLNGVISEDLNIKKTNFEIEPQVGARVSFGYVSEDWIISVTTMFNGIYDKLPSGTNSQLINSSMSLSVSKRFDMKRDYRIFSKDYLEYFKKSDKK